MPSTFSPRLRFELVADGEQLGVWGQTTNRNLGKLIEDALAGYKSIALPNANYTLTAINGMEDESRFLMLEFTGTLTAPRVVTVPAVAKTYLIRNSTNQTLTITPSGGTGAVVPVGRTRSLMSTGTVMQDSLSFADSLNLNSSTIQNAVLVTATINGGTATFSTATINGGLITDTAVRNLPTPTLAGDAARKDYVDAIVNLVQADADAAAASAAAALLSEQNAAASEAQAALFSSIALGAANYQGDYNAATTYMVGQSVTFMGNYFYSKVNNNLNNTPMEGPFWAAADRTAEFVEVMSVSDNTSYSLALLPSTTTGPQEVKVDSAGGTYNPSTNTADINISGNAATATNSTNVNVTQTADNTSYPLVLAPNASTGQKALLVDSAGGTYNPSTNTADLSISGTAAIATTVTVSPTAVNLNLPFVLAPLASQDGVGARPLSVDTSGGGYNPSTNTAVMNITGNAATATTATNVSGGTANVTRVDTQNIAATGSCSFAGAVAFNAGVSLGDAGTDVTTLNAQLSANGSVGTAGQALLSRGANLSPQWGAINSSPISNMQVFTANGTFTIPASVTRIKATVVGGGGGGGLRGSFGGGGGGGGGAAVQLFSGLTPGNTISVVVGAGGASGANGGASSVSSGTQTITTVSATGGLGAPSGGAGAGGGIGSGGLLNVAGDGGSSGSLHTDPGLGIQSVTTGSGGGSLFGGGAQGGIDIANGVPGRAFGGGGSGSGNGGASSGGAGAAGVVIIEW